eukprot:gb/GECG01004152.1/.p1 GENE.gb/GECG01004152.1/~~gb/GECG01004152.1/.p1  ORF type:complete len:176 (+),score=14.44 gb/GECG01004152.1/:1-528(+)
MGKFKNRMQANASTGGGSESTGSGVHEPLLDNEVKGASKRGKTLNGSGAADSGGGSSSSEYTRVVRTIHRDLGQFKNVIQHLRKSNKSVGSDSSSASQNKEINRINTSLDSGEQLVHRISDELKGDLAPLTHASDKETQVRHSVRGKFSPGVESPGLQVIWLESERMKIAPVHLL